MKKKTKVLFSLSALTAAAAGGAAAAEKIRTAFKKDENKRKLYDLADCAINAVTGGLAAILPDVGRPDLIDYESENFYEGDEKFLTAPSDGARWRLGFSKESILPYDVTNDEFYIAGYLAFPPHRADGVLDDLFVRAVALDDCSGRGITVFAVVDCVGISNHDIRDIRFLLEDFAKENNIKSINVSATHCHSGLDTLGIWGDLVGSLKNNVIETIKKTYNFKSGRNARFMGELKEKTAETIKKAVLDMKDGELSIATVDGGKFMHDKRPPDVYLKDINVMRFIPSDGTAPTKAVFMAAHPTCVGYSNCSVSSDFPLYICSQLEETGNNALFFQGAELAIATERGANIPEGLDRFEGIQEYGRVIGRFVESIGEESYKKIEPFINVGIREFYIPVTNKLFLALGKSHLVNHNIVTVPNSSDMGFITEIGYVELGSEYRIALLPGEAAPELLLGGCYSKEESYNHEEWTLPSMNSLTDGYMFAIGLCNDEIGYIVPDNDWGGFVAPLHYEELVSTGKTAASHIVKAFMALVDECKAKKN